MVFCPVSICARELAFSAFFFFGGRGVERGELFFSPVDLCEGGDVEVATVRATLPTELL